MSVFEELVRSIGDQELRSPTIANADIAAHAELFARDLPAQEQVMDLVRYLRDNAILSERAIVDAVVAAMTASAEERKDDRRAELLASDPPTVLQELALGRITAAYRANEAHVIYHSPASTMMAGYVEFDLLREGKHMISGGIDPNGRVST